MPKPHGRFTSFMRMVNHWKGFEVLRFFRFFLENFEEEFARELIDFDEMCATKPDTCEGRFSVVATTALGKDLPLFHHPCKV